MYLFVFVFLIVSVIGLYAEIISLRATQMMNKHTSVGETMMVWHGAMRNFLTVIGPGVRSGFASGCSLTSGFGAACVGSDGNTYQLPAFAAAPLAIYGGRNYLPEGYNFMQAKWNTIFIKISGNHALTYMAPDEMKLGFTATQVYQQLKNSDAPKIIYGQVGSTNCLGVGNGHWLLTQQYHEGVQVCYTVPNTVVDGSIGIISTF